MSGTGVARVVARIQSRHWAAIDRLLVHFYWASSLYELTFCSGRLLYKLNREKRWPRKFQDRLLVEVGGTELKICKPHTPLGLSSLRPWGHQHWVYTSLGRPAPLLHPSYQD